MFNMFSVVNLFFAGIYFLVAFLVKKSGHDNVAEKIKKRAQRCMKEVDFYEGSGPWPEKL